MKSGNFEKFIKCSTNLLIGKVPYRYIGIQVDRDNVSTITYNITFSKKWVDFEKKIKLITTIVLLCQYVIIEIQSFIM